MKGLIFTFGLCYDGALTSLFDHFVGLIASNILKFCSSALALSEHSTNPDAVRELNPVWGGTAY